MVDTSKDRAGQGRQGADGRLIEGLQREPSSALGRRQDSPRDTCTRMRCMPAAVQWPGRAEQAEQAERAKLNVHHVSGARPASLARPSPVAPGSLGRPTAGAPEPVTPPAVVCLLKIHRISLGNRPGPRQKAPSAKPRTSSRPVRPVGPVRLPAPGRRRRRFRERDGKGARPGQAGRLGRKQRFSLRQVTGRPCQGQTASRPAGLRGGSCDPGGRGLRRA